LLEQLLGKGQACAPRHLFGSVVPIYMKCPYCGSKRIIADRALAGREICLGCGRPLSRANKSAHQFKFQSWRSRSTRRNRKSDYFFSRPVGGAFVLFIVITASIVPSLTIIDYRETPAVANSLFPEGLPSGTFGDLSHEPVFKSVIDNGATVVLQDNLSRDGEELAGLWDPNTGTMRISRSSSYGYEDYLDTLKHEAIHMAQSCRGGSLKGETYPLGIWTDPEIDVSTPGILHSANSDRRIELEAYSNSSRSSRWITQLLDDECGSRPWIKIGSNLKDLLSVPFIRLAYRQ